MPTLPLTTDTAADPDQVARQAVTTLRALLHDTGAPPDLVSGVRMSASPQGALVRIPPLPADVALRLAQQAARGDGAA